MQSLKMVWFINKINEVNLARGMLAYLPIISRWGTKTEFKEIADVPWRKTILKKSFFMLKTLILQISSGKKARIQSKGLITL